VVTQAGAAIRLSVRLHGRSETRIPPGSRLAALSGGFELSELLSASRQAGAATCRAEASAKADPWREPRQRLARVVVISAGRGASTPE